MRIEKMDMSRLRNNELFQFHTEILNILTKCNFKVRSLLDQYVVLHNRLDLALNKISKSHITLHIENANKARGKIWRGLVDTNFAATNHYNENVQEAARRLKIVFDTYGNIFRKIMHAQTADFYNILQELRGDYAGDVDTVGLEKWVYELETKNIAFSKLMKERFSESAAKCKIVVKDARGDINKCYLTITDCISSLVAMEGIEDYEQIIKTINAVVETNLMTVKIRTGKQNVQPVSV